VHEAQLASVQKANVVISKGCSEIQVVERTLRRGLEFLLVRFATFTQGFSFLSSAFVFKKQRLPGW